MLKKALVKDPNKRFDSCTEFAEDLWQAVFPDSGGFSSRRLRKVARGPCQGTPGQPASLVTYA